MSIGIALSVVSLILGSLYRQIWKRDAFPITQSAKANVFEHIASLALIIRDWMRDEPPRYAEFIQGARSLNTLDVIVREHLS